MTLTPNTLLVNPLPSSVAQRTRLNRIIWVRLCVNSNAVSAEGGHRQRSAFAVQFFSSAVGIRTHVSRVNFQFLNFITLTLTFKS